MANDRFFRFLRLTCVVLGIGAGGLFPAAGEDFQARAERTAGLVESLNAGSLKREAVVADIYNELRGENALMMKEALKTGLVQGGLLVKLGVVEALAMLGDPRDLDDLEILLDVARNFEIRTTIIRLLPAFILHNNERARLAYVKYVYGGRRMENPAVSVYLRRPPLTRRGRFDKRQDDLVRRVSARRRRGRRCSTPEPPSATTRANGPTSGRPSPSTSFPRTPAISRKYAWRSSPRWRTWRWRGPGP